jgi:hypothetical protein
MKKVLLITLIALSFIGCGNKDKQVQSKPKSDDVIIKFKDEAGNNCWNKRIVKTIIIDEYDETNAHIKETFIYQGENDPKCPDKLITTQKQTKKISVGVVYRFLAKGEKPNEGCMKSEFIKKNVEGDTVYVTVDQRSMIGSYPIDYVNIR